LYLWGLRAVFNPKPIGKDNENLPPLQMIATENLKRKEYIELFNSLWLSF
jgi:hypothetical protein